MSNAKMPSGPAKRFDACGSRGFYPRCRNRSVNSRLCDQDLRSGNRDQAGKAAVDSEFLDACCCDGLCKGRFMPMKHHDTMTSGNDIDGQVGGGGHGSFFRGLSVQFNPPCRQLETKQRLLAG